MAITRLIPKNTYEPDELYLDCYDYALNEFEHMDSQLKMFHIPVTDPDATRCFPADVALRVAKRWASQGWYCWSDYNVRGDVEVVNISHSPSWTNVKYITNE